MLADNTAQIILLCSDDHFDDNHNHQNIRTKVFAILKGEINKEFNKEETLAIALGCGQKDIDPATQLQKAKLKRQESLKSLFSSKYFVIVTIVIPLFESQKTNSQNITF